tara:strand:- start:1071 stop:1187 length:117 start_codon:yes stop_codon:yes gene_type:complete
MGTNLILKFLIGIDANAFTIRDEPWRSVPGWMEICGLP